MVLSQDGKTVDIRKTQQVLGIGSPNRFAIGAETFDVIRFRDLNFVDRWKNEGDFEREGGVKKTLTVSLHRGEQSSLACRFYLP
jgi:hypothetical protein